MLEFRDRRVAELGERLVVASVQASITAREQRFAVSVMCSRAAALSIFSGCT